MTREEAIMILENNRPSCGERIIFQESEVYEAMSMAIEALSQEPSEDSISRKAAIDAVNEKYGGFIISSSTCIVNILNELPSAQPFHNITMNDVLKYIDGMPEDVWQEFTACLECRGWELQRRTANWCGSEFA